MLVLRLVRTGRRNQPKYRLVAAEQGEKLDGKVVEILGHYEPAAELKPFTFDKEKVQGWLSKGAMPSNTVAKLLNGQGFDLPVHLHAEAKPKKKAQAKIDAANKPAEVPKPAEPVSAEEGAPSEPEAVAETPVETVAEETAPVAEEAPSVAEAMEGQMPAEAPAEEASEENKEV